MHHCMTVSSCIVCIDCYNNNNNNNNNNNPNNNNNNNRTTEQLQPNNGMWFGVARAVSSIYDTNCFHPIIDL
jgi:hypothetical protein